MLLPLPSNGAVLPCRTGPVGMRDPETSHCLLHRVIRFYNLKLGQIIWNSNEEMALICPLGGETKRAGTMDSS